MKNFDRAVSGIIALAAIFSMTLSAEERKSPLNATGFTFVKGNHPEGVPDSLVGEHNLYIDYTAKNDDGTINAVIEIPAGTNDKWETDITTGRLFHELKDGTPRVVDYLGYPANYGMIPRTLGGDGDPLDVLVLGGMLQRGTVTPVRVIGVLHLADRGEADDKIIAVLPGTFNGMGLLSALTDLEALYPGVTDIIATWFVNYKGIDGGLATNGFGDEAKAMAIIDSAIVDTNVAAVTASLAHPCDDSLNDTGYTRTFGVYGAPASVPGSCDSLSNGKNMYYAPPFRNADGTINAFTEIPGGTNSKWETGHENGKLFWENKGGLPRIVKYLGYPLSYGMIPQTAYYDGDPLDVVVLGASLPRGSVTPVRLIGVVNLVDQLVVDDKLVAVVPGGPMGDVGDVAELNAKYPGVSTILGAWFSNYKGIGGGVTSKGLVNNNPWLVLDTGVNLFGKFYPENVSAPKTDRRYFKAQARMLSDSRAAVDVSLDRQQPVAVEIHAVNGRMIATRNFGLIDAGSRTVTVDMKSCAPGCYLLKISTGSASLVRPVTRF